MATQSNNLFGGITFHTWTIANEYRRDAFNINNGDDSPKEQESIAVSGQGSLKLFEKFTLTGGIRYDLSLIHISEPTRPERIA